MLNKNIQNIMNMPVKIAVAGSARAEVWNNVVVTLQELFERFKNPVRDNITMEEFKALPKTAAKGDCQGKRKDVGGFVGGHLLNGKRCKGMVQTRSLITLDVDYGMPGVIDTLELMIGKFCIVYSTRKHTPEQPRLRLIFPVAREMSEDEYPAICRQLFADIGIEMFDTTSDQANRLFFYPSVCSDGEYICRIIEGELINPDEYLGRYSDWRNVDEYPRRADEKELTKSHGRQLKADPTLRNDEIGLFCRTYSISEAIGKFLPEVYEETGSSDRFTYKEGTSAGGLVCYDDKFAYSHHDTDPCSGKLCNAWELVRAHLYGAFDTEEDLKKPPMKRSSNRMMLEMARKDANIKMQAEAEDDIAYNLELEALNKTDICNEDCIMEEGIGAVDVEAPKPQTRRNWSYMLSRTKDGHIEKTLGNFVEIFRNDRCLKQIRFNRLSGSFTYGDSGKVLWKCYDDVFNDQDLQCIKHYISGHYDNLYNGDMMLDALGVIGRERSYHPVQEYIKKLPEWDNVKRVDTLFVEYLGADDNVYTREAARKTLCAAITRAFKPGTAFPTVPVLCGPQGAGKSLLINKLGGAFYSDSLRIDDMLDSKKAAEKLNCWIMELGELAGMKKSEQESVKGFISCTVDRYRPVWARLVTSFPRQCILIGTTNAEETGFLMDDTGNRRYWPINIKGTHAKNSWELDPETVDQIWAEAYVYYNEGENLKLSDEAELLAEAARLKALYHDERQGLIAEYLDRLFPAEWDSMDARERQSFLTGGDTTHKGTERRNRFSRLEIWVEALGNTVQNFGKGNSTNAQLITRLVKGIGGWRIPDSNDKNEPTIYGKQKCFTRI